MKTRDLDASEILEWMRDCLHVDAPRGVLLWKKPPHNHPRMIGKEAGSARPNQSGKQYVHVKRDKIALRRGWLIFLWFFRRWPDECLDHIDGNSLNDSIANLRDATVTQNAWNHKGRARRIDLPMGVRLIPSGRYQARIACNKKMLHLGAFDTPEEAQRVYLAKRKELFHEYA